MALDSSGLAHLWERVTAYVAAYVRDFGGDVPIATTSVAGKVKPDGTTITVSADGTISGSDNVPTATTSVAGKVKPDGETIGVDESGTIRVIGSHDGPHWDVRTDGDGNRRLAIVIPED